MTTSLVINSLSSSWIVLGFGKRDGVYANLIGLFLVTSTLPLMTVQYDEFTWLDLAELLNNTHPKVRYSIPPLTHQFKMEVVARWKEKENNPLFMDFLAKRMRELLSKNIMPSDVNVNLMEDYKLYLTKRIKEELKKITDPELKEQVLIELARNKTLVTFG